MALAAVVGLSAAQAPAPAAAPPPTRVEVVVDRMHGVDVADPYRWLEDQQSPATRAWIDAQNAYTRSVLDAWPGRERLRAQLEARSRAAGNQASSPTVRGTRYFYERRAPGDATPSIVVREGLDGQEHVLVDPKALAGTGALRVALMHVSADGRTLAYRRHQGGADQAEVHFLDTVSGEPRADVLPSAIYYTVFLLPDGSGALYSRRRTVETRILEHRFGTSPTDDREHFGAGVADRSYMQTQFSEDGRFVAAFDASQVHVWDRSGSDGFRRVADGLTGVDVAFGGHTLYMVTTSGAQRGRVFAIDPARPESEHWREVIPQLPDAEISTVRAAGGKLALRLRRDTTNQLAVFDVNGTRQRDVALPGLGAAFFWPQTRWDSSEVFFHFSSIAHPPATIRADLSTGAQSTWSGPAMAAGADAVETSQVWYPSKDGTRVPLLLVAKGGLERAGDRPLLLTAYGAYGNVRSLSYEPLASAWVENGGIYAVASVRGGAELGEHWHRDGMLERKQNSIDDLIAAAEWLVANKHTRPDRLGIQGTSAGGMLVTAAAMQRPELFGAVVSVNGHHDMLRYQRFMQAAAWMKEFGNPEVADEFAYLSKYSPYHQVRAGVRYPAILLVTGDNDTTVAPLHSRKMTARLQAAGQQGGPILLRYDLIAGHATGQSIDLAVDQITFLMSQLAPRP
jgi:prolyl oligopeptidase